MVPMGRRFAFRFLTSVLLLGAIAAAPGRAQPITIVDDGGAAVQLPAAPQRVVSLVPAVTEIIVALGAGQTLVGVTHHDRLPAAMASTAIVGGFLSPSAAAIAALAPDAIFYAGLHQPILDRFRDDAAARIRCDTSSLAHSLETIRRLGLIFRREAQAESLVQRQQAQWDLLTRKTATLPAGARRRVMRVMGRGAVMTPGADSFQNEIIRLAGGLLPPNLAPGAVVPVSLEAWQAFNPQVIFGCGDDGQEIERLKHREAWREVDALRNGQVLLFPCALTCRAAAHSGDFAAWLASRIYAREFADPAHQILPDGVIASRPIPWDLANVRSLQVVETRLQDFAHKTLVLSLETPTAMMSTLEGPLEAVSTVGNHYLPPPSWSLSHGGGVADLKRQVCRVLERPVEASALLFTGVDLDHLAVTRESYAALQVTALVTAGVEGNAVCMSQDVGGYYEPGTINILLHTNARLSRRAQARAVISATEAKSAALADLDIRSSYQPREFGATGTGTDNLIVIPSPGPAIDNAGGHSKMGELIARAVYRGVKEAIARQNGLTPRRSIFQRLRERQVDLAALLEAEGCPCVGGASARLAALEALLLDPAYHGFLEAALALSDAHRRGLLGDLAAFRRQCDAMAQEIAGGPVGEGAGCFSRDSRLPEPLALALGALMAGLEGRDGTGTGGPPPGGAEKLPNTGRPVGQRPAP